MTDKSFHPVTHVIFDMDGLLLNTEPLYESAIGTVCSNHGSSYTLAAKRLVMGTTASHCAQVVVDQCRLPITPEQFLAQCEAQYPTVFANVSFMPGAERLVSHFCDHGVPIAIATSSKSSTFRYKSQGKEEFFGKFSHIVVGSDDPDVQRGKPHPDIFHVAADRFRERPGSWRDVLVFEDSVNGVKAAVAAGMQVVWVPDPCLEVEGQEATQVLGSLTHFKPEEFGLPGFS